MTIRHSIIRGLALTFCVVVIGFSAAVTVGQEWDLSVETLRGLESPDVKIPPAFFAKQTKTNEDEAVEVSPALPPAFFPPPQKPEKRVLQAQSGESRAAEERAAEERSAGATAAEFQQLTYEAAVHAGPEIDRGVAPAVHAEPAIAAGLKPIQQVLHTVPSQARFYRSLRRPQYVAEVIESPAGDFDPTKLQLTPTKPPKKNLKRLPVPPWQPWWKQRLGKQNLSEYPLLPIRLDQLMELALVNSPAINIARLDVAIEREGIPEQIGRFDWNAFVQKLWTDTDEPTGSELQAGMGAFRLLEEDFQTEYGLRRTNRLGGRFEFGQQFQVRNSNSQFFDPNDQGLSRLTLRYDQPLLREGGIRVNMGRVYIAKHLAEASRGDAQAAVRDLLFEVTTRYWGVYRARGNVMIQEALHDGAIKILAEINKRRKIDAGRRLIVLAEATVSLRRAQLVAARTALSQAQNELTFFVSVPNWDKQIELLPQDIPFESPYVTDEQTEIHIALTQRAEIHAAIERIQASSVQKSITQNDLLPRLAFQMRVSAAGINGDFDVGESFVDQFSTGAPTYSLGFNFEQPIGNRTAIARDRRAALQMARFTAELDEASDLVKIEVKNAFAELQGTYHQMRQFADAATKAQEEIAAISRRRWLFPDLNGVTTLYLREILDAQQRLATAEQQYLDTQIKYSIAILDLRRANGTLCSEGSL